MEHLVELIIGVLVGLGAAVTFFLKGRKGSENPTTLEEHEKEVESKLEEIEKKEEQLKQDGVVDLSGTEVTDYWKNEDGSSGVGLPGLLFVVLLTLKLCKVIDYSWWLITAPLYVLFIVYFVLFIVMVLIKSRR